MHYVYILQSENHPSRFYVGKTRNLKRRFRDHNAGTSTHTNRFKPWTLYWYAAFPSLELARNFEATNNS